jgi:TrmH family RNA methyltransferase
VVERFARSRHDPSLAVIEGFHALKHALRFGAEVLEAVAPDLGALDRLARELAPDVAGRLAEVVAPVDAGLFRRLVPRGSAEVAAIARRPEAGVSEALVSGGPAPAVLLDSPRHPSNVGAAIRVAAAAGARAVAVTGDQDPWHPAAIRGAAGLQFALPVGLVPALPASARPLVLIDPGRPALDPRMLPDGAVLAFGSERRGLGEELRGRADLSVGLPMRDGVSSINLAAAVAAVLYAWRLGRA